MVQQLQRVLLHPDGALRPPGGPRGSDPVGKIALVIVVERNAILEEIQVGGICQKVIQVILMTVEYYGYNVWDEFPKYSTSLSASVRPIQGGRTSSGQRESPASGPRHGALPHSQHALQQKQRLPGEESVSPCSVSSAGGFDTS